jgi:hypothetical protein
MEQQWNIIRESVESSIIAIGQFLPKLLLAVVILVVGWLIAKLVQYIVVRGLKAIGFGVITDKAGLDGFLKKGGVRKTTIDVLGALVYWLIVLMTLLTTFNTLGLAVVSELFSRVTLFIPNVIVAVLILTIGLYFARFVSDAITTYTRNVGMEDSHLVGRMTYYAIAVFVVVTALGQVGIGDVLLYGILQIVVAGIVFALALAFGLGGQKWAAEQIDRLSKKK